MPSHPSPACKAANACKAAHDRKAGLTHDNVLLVVKWNNVRVHNVHRLLSHAASQAMVLGPVATPGVAQLMQQAAAAAAAERGTDATAAAAAAAAKRRQSFTKAPSAEAVAAAMIKCIGKGGPVVTPYWRHALQQQLMLGECLWPPALQRAVMRAVSRCAIAAAAAVIMAGLLFQCQRRAVC
jgi:hypothetical protein